MNNDNVTAFPAAAETQAAATTLDAASPTMGPAPELVAIDPTPSLDASQEPLNETEYATKADLLLLQQSIGEFQATTVQAFATMDNKVLEVKGAVAAADEQREDHFKVLAERIDELAVAEQSRKRLKKGDPTGYRAR